ncbi:Ig domain-containing protein [Clostridium botulinum]|nr:Ig domain-containing protein [Clostridium botulinum]
MKKKIGLIMSMVLLFVFVFSGVKNTHIAHAEGNNEFVIGTHNLNNTEKNSGKVGDKINEPEKGWKRYDDTNKNISYIGSGWGDSSFFTEGRFGKTTKYVIDPNANNKIQFSFIGSKIRTYGCGYDSMQSHNIIIIDGIKYDMGNWSQIANNVVGCSFEKTNLEFKKHNVEIEYGGSARIYLDAIDIDENGELKPYEEKQEIKAESISLDKISMDLLEGSSDKLNAKVLPEDATNKKVVWSSSDEKIATVDKDGKVTAIKEGQATITAKVEGTDLTATCKINVTKKVEENKNNAILSISLVNGATKEYDVNMQEVEKFINWFEERSNGKGSSLYSFNKKINPYKSVKEYIVHDKIASFEVREYEGTNK